MRNAKTIASKPSSSAAAMSRCSQVGASEGGAATRAAGAGESPEAQPMPATIRMHISTAPGTFRCSRATITTNPRSARATGHWVMEPIATSVASLPTTSPALRRPMITRKKTDPRRDGQLLRPGNAVHHPFPDGKHGQDQHQHARAEDGAERSLPRQPHRAHRDHRKVGVQPHSGCQRDGKVGVQPHRRRPERGRQAGRHQHGPGVHPGSTQDHRVHEDDVGHGQEGGESGDDLPADGSLSLFQFEVLQHGSFFLLSSGAVWAGIVLRKCFIFLLLLVLGSQSPDRDDSSVSAAHISIAVGEDYGQCSGLPASSVLHALRET